MMQAAVDTFQAISDPSRRQMLHLLSKKRLTINGLAENFDMSRPAVSKHVRILHSAGLITIEESGRERHCQLNPKGFQQLRHWLGYYDQFWNNKLQKLDRLLQEKTSNK